MAFTSQLTTSVLQVEGRNTEGGVIEIVPGARLLLDVGVDSVEGGALLDEIAAAVVEAQAARDEAVDISGISTSDGVIASRITTPGTATQTALSATIGATLSADPTLRDALATRLAAITPADLPLSYTLPEGLQPTPAALALLRGTPTYETHDAGKAMTNAVVAYTPTDTVGFWTIECHFKSGVIPAGNRALMTFQNYYIGIAATLGTLYWTDPASTKAGPNVCDGNWHHIAFTVQRGAADAYTRLGVWVDGVSAFGAGPTITQPWTQAVLGGLFSGTGALASTDATREARLDDWRISYSSTAPRYSGASFTPPTPPYTLDAETVIVAGFSDTTAAVTPVLGYPTRPTAPPGAVTYIGGVDPAGSALENDRWIEL